MILSDRYIRKRLMHNWQTLLIIILAIIFLSIVIKNVSQIPYQNQHEMTTTLPLKFEYEGKTVRGFVYTSYWVETERQLDQKLSKQELSQYLNKHGYIDLRPYKKEMIKTLKSYSLSEIKENWYDDLEYFQKNDIYYINNDKAISNKLRKINFDIKLPYEIKKSFFVYLDTTAFAEFVKKQENNNS